MAESSKYKEPMSYAKTGDVIFANAGQEVELLEREVDGKLNPLFVKYRNASARIYAKNGDIVRILFECNGVVDTSNPLAAGKVICKSTERQPFYSRLRVEEPTEKIPAEPSEDII